ncbi:DUF4192 domain-containing protein [Actinoplanes sp. NPDC049681]|uniref:DUF4192 domain-containing protein n=1 Tax=Actinoplanes sp. NPDC049681 TaxID=3363905 RepID=UPI0037A554D9
MTKLKVRTPAELISAVPFLIGFHPADSLVAAAVKGARLAFAARIDLPEPGVPDLEARAPVVHLATLIAEQAPEGIVLIGYGDSARVTPSLHHLSRALTSAGLRIIDEFRVAEGRFWSYLCTNPSCCPVEGTPCDPPDSVVATEATFAGAVALPSRKDLESQLAPVTGDDRTAMDEADVRAQRRMAELLKGGRGKERPSPPPPITDAGASAPARVSSTATRHFTLSLFDPSVFEPSAQPLGWDERLRLRAGRIAVREAERRYRTGGRLTDDEVAWLGLLLESVAVRDYAWIRSGVDDWQAALWSDIVRRVHPQRVPAPASLLAFIAWRTGRGPLASIAVDRALDADPGCALACAINAALFLAIPPSSVDGWPMPVGSPARLPGGKTVACPETGQRRAGDKRPAGDKPQAGDNRRAGDKRPAGDKPQAGDNRRAGDNRPAGGRARPSAGHSGRGWHSGHRSRRT